MKRPKLLIIDDEPDISEIFSMMVEDEFDFDIVEEFNDALEKIANNSYDIIITDITMPDGSGLDIIAHSKEHRPDIPVLVMSGFSENDDEIKKAKEVGAKGQLSKPFSDQEEILAYLKQFL